MKSFTCVTCIREQFRRYRDCMRCCCCKWQTDSMNFLPYEELVWFKHRHDWNEHLCHLTILEGFKIWIELAHFHSWNSQSWNQPLRSNGQVIFSAEHVPYIHWGAQGSPLWFRLGRDYTAEGLKHWWLVVYLSFLRYSGWIWEIHVRVYCSQAGFKCFFISTCTYFIYIYILKNAYSFMVIEIVVFLVGWFLEP